MKKDEMFDRLKADSQTGADLSPGDPVSAWAVEEIDQLREKIRRALSHLRGIVAPWEGHEFERVPQHLRELRSVFDALRGLDNPAAQVAGETLGTPLWQYVARAQHLLIEEQEKPLPDNSLISFLADSVRLARERSPELSPPLPPGFIEMGASPDGRDVVMNLPYTPDNGTGFVHFAFTPHQAINAGEMLIRKAHSILGNNLETFRFKFEGLTAGGNPWHTEGKIDGDMANPLIFRTAMGASFQQLTSGRAVFGKPGLGCQGPYKITRFTLEKVAQ